MMMPETASSPPGNKFSAVDVAQILKERNWLVADPTAEKSAWCERAAALLGPQSPDRAALENLLALIFHYDAREVLGTQDAHVVMSRYAARDVLRKLANLLLEPVPLTRDRFQE